MKRLLSLALVLALALTFGGCAEKQKTTTEPTVNKATVIDSSPQRPVGIYAVEEQLRDNDFWAQKDTTVAERNQTFYVAQEELFDYFYGLWGFGVSTSRESTGRFDDTELLHSVCAQLWMDEGKTSFTEEELNTAAKRYYNQTITDFSGCEQCSYDSKSKTYTWNTACITLPGNYMVLRQLRVQEDGLCVGVFDRSHERYYTGDLPSGGTAQEDLHKSLRDGAYDDLSRVETVTVTFRECKDGNGVYFVQVLSIYPYTGIASNSK